MKKCLLKLLSPSELNKGEKHKEAFACVSEVSGKEKTKYGQAEGKSLSFLCSLACNNFMFLQRKKMLEQAKLGKTSRHQHKITLNNEWS